MKSILTLLATLFLIPLPASHAADASEATTKPNIVFLLADDLRPDCLGMLGHPGSGQSNMAMKVSGSNDVGKEKAAANLPQLRMFTVTSEPSANPEQDCVGSWVLCSPETVGEFSATLYFFGREIHKSLSVPIGLIHSSVGGTPIEAWTAAEVQPQSPAAKKKSVAPNAKAVGKENIGGLYNGKIAPLIRLIVGSARNNLK